MPKPHTPVEWAEIYKEKTGDEFDIEGALNEGYRFLYLAERGIATMKIDLKEEMLFIGVTCGDGRFWRDYAELMAAANGLKYLATLCTRHIRPYIRGFGWQILNFEERDGKERFLCQDSIGRMIIITYWGDNDKGEPQYMVTHYLTEKATADFNDIEKWLVKAADKDKTEETTKGGDFDEKEQAEAV